ncbi:MAG: hypothetical protein KC635_10600 [Myxococcales bacterium]|nr:hypothetical protein [Myxococcales bacterium]
MSRVPRHLHVVFGLRPQTEPFHLVYYLAVRSALALNRFDRATMWVHHTPFGPWWDRLRPELDVARVDLVPAVLRARYPDADVRRYDYAHHADFVRLAALVEHGGVYVDIDTICAAPYEARLFEHPMVLGEELPGALCNAVIFAEPGAELARRWLDGMAGALDGSWSGHSNGLATALAAADPELVHVEPARAFYRHGYDRAGIRALMTGDDPDRRGVMSLHLWNHLWWARGRVASTTLHGGLLTEDFIRAVDTTYTRLARPHLPPGRAPSRAARRRAEATLRGVRLLDRALDLARPLNDAARALRARAARLGTGS